MKLAGVYEVLPKSEWLPNASNKFCHETAPTQPLCAQTFFAFAGPDNGQLNRTMIPVITGHVPAGASTQQLFHFVQLYNTGNFEKYDYGSRKNKKIYGTKYPPKYDLSRVEAPIVLYSADDDWLIDPEVNIDFINISLPPS